MPDLHRKSPRASRYDYTSPGGYFITICTKDREHYFGEIIDGKMILNDLGKITRDMRNNIPVFHPHVDIHEFVCMPNHIHGILIIGENKTNNNTHAVGTHYMRPKNDIHPNNKDRCNLSLPSVQCLSESLGSIIRGFKIGVTKYANEHDIAFARQGRYHDHIIRNEGDYDRITYYIQTNPENRNKEHSINNLLLWTDVIRHYHFTAYYLPCLPSLPATLIRMKSTPTSRPSATKNSIRS